MRETEKLLRLFYIDCRRAGSHFISVKEIFDCRGTVGRFISVKETLEPNSP